jgi:hypothetical protein
MHTKTVFNFVHNVLTGGFGEEKPPGIKWDWEEFLVRQDLEASTSLRGHLRYLQTHPYV